MTRTHENVRHAPESKRPEYSSISATLSVQNVLGVLEGRWKFFILFELFGGRVRRFSDLERAIPGVSQKMLTQQLRQLEADGVVARVVHPEVPPRVEYHLTAWGQALCPVLDSLLMWAETGPAEARARLIVEDGGAG